MLLITVLLLTVVVATANRTAESDEVFIDFSHEEHSSVMPSNRTSRVLQEKDTMFYRTDVEDADIHKAYCLDGSPYKYFLRKNPASTEWVIIMKGGGDCESDETCWLRTKWDGGSSNFLPETMSDLKGILDLDEEDNPRFNDANLVYLSYCDGMSHSAAFPNPVHVEGVDLYFRGKMNVGRALTDLWKYHGLGSASTIIFGGAASGSHGAYYLGDWLGGVIASTGRAIDFKLLIGDGSRMDSREVDLWMPARRDRRLVEEKYNYLLSRGVFHDTDCTFTGTEEWKCLVYLTYSAQFVTTPKFQVTNGVDANHIDCAVGRLTTYESDPDCETAEEYPDCDPVINGDCSRGYILNDWAFFMKNSVFSALDPLTDGAFVPNCFSHSTIIHNDFRQVEIEGVLMRDAIAAWVDDLEPNSEWQKHFHGETFYPPLGPPFPLDEEFFDQDPTCVANGWPFSSPE